MSFLAKWLERLKSSDGPVWDGGQGSCVALLDREGRIVSLSDSAPALLARSNAAATSERLAALFASAHEADIERALRASGRVSVAMENGRRFDLSCRERPDGLRAVLILEARAAAEAPPTKAEPSETAKLLADLSHEMRTPLNAVIGFAETMTSETFGPLGHEKYAEYAAHIRASGAHLLDLVTSILDLAKIEADRFALRREIVDIGAIVRECAGIMRIAVDEAGLKLDVRIEDGLPECWLDPRAVRQILLNLLSNAVKFTSDGGIALEAALENGAVVLTVSDTGVGMNEAELKRLGARFTAARGDGVRGAKGAGLGLSLAFALAELHGGAMTLASAPGEGMTARVRLPAGTPAARARPIRLAANDARTQRPAPAILSQLDRIEAYRRQRGAAA